MSISRRAALTVALPFIPRTEAQVVPAIVRFDSEMEPLVRLMEDTTRQKCPAMLLEQLRTGVPYRQLMAALYLAGVRNVNPRPPGFALHCLFIMHSAHLLSLEAPPELRALPLFFALDQFKASQERDAKGKDYTMAPLAGALPSPDRAAGELTAAMEAWDEERAERAVAVLARTRGAAEAFELLWRYGVRDYRNIGHKAIFLSNACRTLHTIGWQHGETVLRSLMLGLLDFGKETKVNGFALEDQTYGANARRTGQAWTTGPAEAGDTMAVLAAIRDNTPVKACDEVAARMTKGLTPASVWDAVHLAAAELTMRTADGGVITGIHAVSAANAMHYAWQAAADGRTRLLILQQAVGWMGQFRIWAEMGKGIRSIHIDDVPPSEPLTAGQARDQERQKLEPLGARVSGQVTGETRFVEIFERAKTVAGRRQYVAETLRHVIPKANEVHYYKFPAALIEDIPLVSPRWQPHLAATMSYYTKGPTDAETAPMKRALEG